MGPHVKACDAAAQLNSNVTGPGYHRKVLLTLQYALVSECFTSCSGCKGQQQQPQQQGHKLSASASMGQSFSLLQVCRCTANVLH